jgi:NAD(P)H-dependent FMN reductase
MKNILTIGASTSSISINKIFAEFAASKIENIKVVKSDLNNFELPIYSSDLEEEISIPENAIKFKELIDSVDGIILSLAEHNGLPSAAFKNLFDWLSRIDQNIWLEKPMLLLATSPGARGGANVLGIMKNMLPYFGGNIISDFSLPSFYENFSNAGIADKTLSEEFDKSIKAYNKILK